MPFRQWEYPESRLRLRTRRLEKLRCPFAQMPFCSDAPMPRSVKTAPAVLTEYVRVTKEGDLCYNNTSYGKEGTFLGTV